MATDDALIHLTAAIKSLVEELRRLRAELGSPSSDESDPEQSSER